MRLTAEEITNGRLSADTLADAVQRIRADGYVIFESVLPPDFVQELHTEFMAVFSTYIAQSETNRGTNRHQMHLPFRAPFNDERIITSPFALPVIDALLGEEYVCRYFASDTPLPGSDYQAVHSDIPALFPNSNTVVPAYALVLNIPLVDFTPDNGPLEVWPGGTHYSTLPPGEIQKLAPNMHAESVLMPAGSLLIRDGRMWHRGTPNRANAPRPNLALVYSYPWLASGYKPIGIPADTYEQLSPRAQKLFRQENIGGEVFDPVSNRYY